MIHYPQFFGKDWQIGSDPADGTYKPLTARLKGSGMRWDAANAQALVRLEALKLRRKELVKRRDRGITAPPSFRARGLGQRRHSRRSSASLQVVEGKRFADSRKPPETSFLVFLQKIGRIPHVLSRDSLTGRVRVRQPFLEKDLLCFIR
jgi:hypothetical protein